MNAVERGQDLLMISMSQLPPLALGYARHLCNRIGGCIEVFLTAYAAYAQEVEGLACDDEMYRSSPEAVAWFAAQKEDGADVPIVVEPRP